MVARGEVKLSDPVAKYLPPGRATKVFRRQTDLAPRFGHLYVRAAGMADEFACAGQGKPQCVLHHTGVPANSFPHTPYGQLYEFLSGYMPRYYPGSHYEYSNAGFGLLGHVLSLRAGRSYEALELSLPFTKNRKA